MKRRVWGHFHTIRGADLTDIGAYTKEGLEGLGLGFGQGRLGEGFRLTPGSSASKVKLGAGWALLETSGGTLHQVRVDDTEVDFSGESSGTYDLVGTVAEASLSNETITPPPQTLPNGNDNPFYDSRFSSYLLDTAVESTVTLNIQAHPHSPGANEVVIGTVHWDGSQITQGDITELIDYPTPHLGADSITAYNLAPDTAGDGLVQAPDGSLAVNPDGSSLEISGDQVRVKDGGITDNMIGNRTVTDTQVPGDNVGSITDLFSELANRLKAATGKSSWRTDPRVDLEHAAGKGLNETVSGAWTFSTTPQVPLTPLNDADVPSKKYVDDTVNAGSTALDNHKNATPLDHPDGSVTDAKIGNRTVTDTTVPAGDTDALETLLSGIGNRLKAITGEGSWRTDPATTLDELNTNAARKNQNETVAGVWTFSGDEVYSKRLRLTAGDDVSPASTSHAFQVGADSGFNLRVDVNEIMVVNNGAVEALHLNPSGGAVHVWNSTAAVSSTPILVGSENYKVWHEGNDGSGSGLDADTVDGIDSTQFLRSDTSDIAAGYITFARDDATSHYKFAWKSTGSNAHEIRAYAADGDYAGFNPHDSSGFINNGYFSFNFAAGHWEFGKTPYVGSNEMIHAGNIGNYTSSNADQLDGLDSTQFLRSDVDDEFEGNQLSVLHGMSVGGDVVPGSHASLHAVKGVEVGTAAGDVIYGMHTEFGAFFITREV